MKIFQTLWTTQVCLVIVCVLSFGRGVSARQGDEAVGELQARLAEALVACNVAEQRCAELRATLTLTRNDLEALQGKYASLLSRAREREVELEALRIGVAGLLSESSAATEVQSLAMAMLALRETQTANAALYGYVREFADYLRGVVDALDPSAAVRREISLRIERLEARAEMAERSPSIVAGRGGSYDRSRRECRVLAVNDDLQMVILDAGLVDGVRLGMLWQTADSEGRLPVAVRVVEVRASLCAAVPVAGKLGDLAPGTLLKAGVAGAE